MTWLLRSCCLSPLHWHREQVGISVTERVELASIPLRGWASCKCYTLIQGGVLFWFLQVPGTGRACIYGGPSTMLLTRGGQNTVCGLDPAHQGP